MCVRLCKKFKVSSLENHYQLSFMWHICVYVYIYIFEKGGRCLERLKEESQLLEVVRKIPLMFQPNLSDRQKMCWHMTGNAISLLVEHRFFQVTTSQIFVPVSVGFLFVLILQSLNLLQQYICNTFDLKRVICIQVAFLLFCSLDYKKRWNNSTCYS